MKRLLSIIALSCLLYSCAEKSLEVPGALPPSAGGTGGGNTPTTPTTPVGVGTLTFNLDGAAQNFSVNTNATITTVSTYKFLTISGFKDATANYQMSVLLQSDSAIKVGTYSDAGTSETKPGLGYREPSGQYVSNLSTTAPTVVTITAITATTIEGTFQGDIELANTNGTFGQKLSVTNGKFNLKLQ